MTNLTFQYIWVEKYRCFDNMEFNFSAKHYFHYDKDENTLTYENHSEDYVDDFFGENIDMTAVIGNNGSGKTSFIKTICENFVDGCGGVQTNCIVVMQVNAKLKCYYYLNARKNDELRTLRFISPIESDIPCFNLAEQKTHNGNTVYEANKESKATYFPQLFEFGKLFRMENVQTKSNMRFIRLTQTLDHADYSDELYGVTDLSTSRILWIKHDETLSEFLSDKDEKLPKDSCMAYFHYNFANQINFFCNYMKTKETNCIIPFKRPDYVVVSIEADITDALIELKKERRDYRMNEEDQKQIRMLVLRFWNKETGMTKDLYTELSKGIIANCIRSIASLQTDNQKLYDIIVTAMKNTSENSESPIGYRCRQFLEELRFEIDIKRRLEPFNTTFLIDYINRSRSFLEFVESFKSQGSNSHFVKSFTVSLEETDASANHLNLNILCGIEKFYKKYREIAEWRDFLHFSWRLSSGEMALLNVYSRFFSIAKNISDDKDQYSLTIDQNSHQKVENALIFIDEADMLFHPEWQQKYINSLLPFLRDIYSGTHLQVIIATHSPVILSDIPKQNVIYLNSVRNDEGKLEYSVDDPSRHTETFGANIFRLFNDAFFLKEGAIGEFAEEKLKELLKMIDHSAKEKTDTIQKLIRLIGDPFLKAKVETYFLSKLDQNEELKQQLIEKEIAWLNQKLAVIKVKDGKGDMNGKN